MYPISNAVKALFEAEQKQILRITGTDKNGVAISITDADLLLDSFNIDRFSCNGAKLEIGTATSAQLELKLNNANGQFNDIIFEGSELFVEIGIGSPVNWIPCGYFTPDEQPRKLTTISLKALDRMTRFDAIPPTLTPWTDNNGNNITDGNGNIIYFCAELVLPATIEELIKQCCVRCSIPFTQDISSLPNYNYQITSMPDLQENVTFRSIIQWCAGLIGTNAYIDWNGNLCFSWYSNTTGYVSTTTNRFDSDLHENALTITGVEFTDTDEDNTIYLVGSDEYSIDLTGNPFVNADNVSAIISNIYNVIRGFIYTPFNATIISAPYLWPMDIITFTDKDGNTHNSVLTNVSFGLNGNTSLASTGMTMQLNSGVQSSVFTAQQIQEMRKIQRVNSDNLKRAVDTATALITGADGGYVRFIYDGDILSEIVIMDTDDIETATKIWRWNSGGLGYSSNGYNGPYTLAMTQNGAIVADFITAGEMNADRIRGGTLTIGGNNDVNGLLQVQDASGNVVGTWNNSGLNITKGSIYFPDNNAGSGYIGINYGGYVLSLHKTFTSSGEEYINVVNPHVYIIRNITLDNAAQLTDVGFVARTNSNGSIPQLVLQNEYNNIVISLFASSTGLEIIDTNNHITLFQVFGNNGNITTKGNLSVDGTKSRRVTTSQYSDRLLYCYETPSPMFGDIGEGVIGEDGLCYVTIDPVFAQTITTDRYQVFLQAYDDGTLFVKKRYSGYFIVQGTPGMAFGWEIKAKQRDFDQRRLDSAQEPYTPEHKDYGAEAAQYIAELKKEREAA